MLVRLIAGDGCDAMDESTVDILRRLSQSIFIYFHLQQVIRVGLVWGNRYQINSAYHITLIQHLPISLILIANLRCLVNQSVLTCTVHKNN